MKLIVGIILILMSVVHIIYGEKMQTNILKKLKADSILIGSFRSMSLQGGLILFAVGLMEILVYLGIIELLGIAEYIPLGIVSLNMIAVLAVALLKHRDLIKATVPQFIIFSFILLLQALSIT